MGRTLVKVIASESYIDSQLFSLEHKASPHFYLPREKFEELERDEMVLSKSVSGNGQETSLSAYFHRFLWSRELFICFVWSGAGQPIRSDSIRLPYDDLAAFVKESRYKGAQAEWKMLSLEELESPRLVFCDKRNLRQCLVDKTIRHKLVHCLRDKFQRPDVREIRFYDRATPYSFTYQEICDTDIRRVGSITLLHQDDLEKAYYLETSRPERNPLCPECYRSIEIGRAHV